MITLSPAEAYRAIAATYDAAPNPLTALEHRTLVPLLPELRDLLIADIAAGTGRWTRYFQSHGARTIAVDLCRDMLAYAPHPLVQADNISLPLRTGAFDLVLCSFALGYEPDAFPELIRITRPGGQLIITDVHPDAIRRGWSRSFRVDGEIIAPKLHPYSLDDLHHPSLALRHFLEPHIAEPERDIFAQAGKPDAFKAACEHPAIFIAIFENTMITVENIPLDLGELAILPGLINTHDHLEFALFPLLGRGPYPNAKDWAHDIHRTDAKLIETHLAIPKHLRLLWGGLRNLLAGVTTVCHHNPYNSIFDADFPVRVVRHYGWAHSLAFEPDIRARFDATPHNAPFLIHAAEGTDEEAESEIFELDKLGVLSDRTVIIHGVALNESGRQLLRERGASLIWCPRSNSFLFDKTIDPPRKIPTALGTDSSITAEGDLLDEIASAQVYATLDDIRAMVTTEADRVLRLPPTTDVIAAPAFAEPPQLVVINDRIHLIAPHLADQLPENTRREFYELHVCGRPPVLVRWNIPELIASTRDHLDPIRLAGREVLMSEILQ